MKSLKAGIVPKRGNPNNPEDQEGFDTNEGEDEKQPVRKSTKGGSGYPTLGPAPNLGLPSDDDEEEKKSEKRDDSDDSDESDKSDRSDSPPPQKKEEYKPPPPKPAPKSKGGSKVKGREFYKAIENAKKHCQNAISNLGYSVVEPSIEELEKAIDILRELQ